MLACLQERQLLMYTVYTYGKDIDLDVINENQCQIKLNNLNVVNLMQCECWGWFDEWIVEPEAAQIK